MKYTTLLIATVALITACKHEPELPKNIPTPAPTPIDTPANPPVNDSVCFNTEIQPLFNSSCAYAGCHDAVTQADGYQFTSYTNIRNQVVPFQVNSGKVMRAIKETDPDKRMPPGGPLSQNQIALLEKWINQGALNRNCNPNTCDTQTVTYAVQIASIVQTNCLGCHASQPPLLNNYTQVKQAVQSGNLIASIKHQAGVSAMPKNQVALSFCKIRTFEKWVEQNYLP
ncbi:MAG: hypothetical protein MUE96_01050 [Bacteroidia bacterium]|jgi:hypothetical protein|nr:hypothetical protein [Bacteroidia bacterium]